jgi:hypothetical protein
MARWNKKNDWAWTENQYGERPVDDVNEIIRRLDMELGRSKVVLCLKSTHLRDQILEYLWWRHRKTANDISVPLHSLNEPRDWSSKAEELWTDWIQDTFPPERWTSMILEPVFGTDERYWESRVGGPGWRMEIYDMIQWWVQREWTIVDKFDPLPDEETGSNMEDDAIMMDEYDGRRRRR